MRDVMYSAILSVIILAWITTIHAFGVNDAVTFLDLYNYYDTSDKTSGNLRTISDLTLATRRFQRMNGLDETGTLDGPTLSLMQMPRCGLPDNTGTNNRARRYALGDTKWYKKDLTWRLENRTPDLPATRVDEIMASALQLWADSSQLTFRQVQSGDADIVISFRSGSHGDGNPFDGAGSVLAHAYFPTNSRTFDISGDAHFDESETFSDGVARDINLFQVAVHEFGHSLGLGHSEEPNALMAAFFRGFVPNAELHADDVAGIQALYGADSGMPEVEGTQTSGIGGQSCIANFVAAAQTSGEGSFLFNATHAFLVDIYGIVNSPEPIGSMFTGMVNNMDAAFYYPSNRKTYFLKGSNYWRYSDFRLDSGYPKNIQAGFGSEAPSDVDAAFVWSGNGRVYFVKDDLYYRYSVDIGNIDPGYPRPLSVWNGIGTKVDAAFQFENRQTYFFTGGEYRRFDDNAFSVASSYPQPATRWLKCDDSQIVASPGPTNSTGNGAVAIRGCVSFVTVLMSFVIGLTQLL